MNYIQRSSRWKIIFVICGLIIVLISLYYTRYLAQKLAEGEKDKVKIFAWAFESLNKSPLDADVALEQQIIERITKSGIPLILTDEMGRIQEGYNYGSNNHDLEYLKKQLEIIKAQGNPPVRGTGYAAYIYYSNSFAYKLLTYFPLVQVVLLLIFLITGFLVFSSIRKSEQNLIWAGLAKETAHQLGTPISSIIGWVELLKVKEELSPSTREIFGEIGTDVKRLELISQRFSRIGSRPELKKANLVELLIDTADYMKKRSPRKVEFDFPSPEVLPPIYAQVNSSLFEWVIENLIRNALDSMDGKGKITGTITRKNQKVFINIKDTGKGIPGGKQKVIFKPGYSTKKRGWGLGLSLSKRIINNYHKGNIYVKLSSRKDGTTFTIQLPVIEA